MTTLGYTATPGAGVFSVAANTENAAAIQATMPSPGGTITALHAHFRAFDSGSHTAWLCVWNSGGTLLASVAVSVGGGQQLYSANLASPIFVAGGTVLYIGFVIGSIGYTVEYDSTGTSYNGSNATSPPGNISFGSSGFGTIEAYADYVLGMYVNTGTPAVPVWTPAPVTVNTGTPAAPVWTAITGDLVNTGTPAVPVWTQAS